MDYKIITKKLIKEVRSLRQIVQSKKDQQNKFNQSVICTNTGEIFATIKEAAKFYGVCETNICKVCKNKLKHTGGYHFQYLKDYREEPIPVVDKNLK